MSAHRVCDRCGHIEDAADHDDYTFECSACGSTVGWEFADRRKAEQHAADIRGRKASA